jgi:hypothetical protein
MDVVDVRAEKFMASGVRLRHATRLALRYVVYWPQAGGTLVHPQNKLIHDVMLKTERANVLVYSDRTELSSLTRLDAITTYQTPPHMLQQSHEQTLDWHQLRWYRQSG